MINILHLNLRFINLKDEQTEQWQIPIHLLLRVLVMEEAAWHYSTLHCIAGKHCHLVRDTVFVDPLIYIT